MSWGYRILFLYLGFVTLIMVLVFKSMSQKVDLVSANYYEEELKYQDKIDAINNLNELNEPVSVLLDGTTLNISLPKDVVRNAKGDLYIYRASDKNLDIRKTLSLDESGKQSFNNLGLVKGFYNVKVSWVCDDKNYFYERALHVK